MDKYIIRTSDRKTFKKCRVLWEFTSKIRMDYETFSIPQPLRFGIAFHKAMEVLHDPKTWSFLANPQTALVVHANALAAFIESYPKPLDTYGQPINDPQLVAEWQEQLELGKSMIANYIAQGLDMKIKPVFDEIEFEVPVLVPDDCIGDLISWTSTEENKVVGAPIEFTCRPVELHGDEQWQLYYLGKPVVYQGRIDLVRQDELDYYWIVDWKTAAKFDSLAWLEVEEQITSYLWAFQILTGGATKGFDYVELFKGAPGEPKVLNSGKLSKDKSQNVTEKTYRAAIDRLGLNVADYADFLEYLANNERQYFRRQEEARDSDALRIAGRRIFLEAMDMVREDIAIYPNPSKMNCNNCGFRYPCALQSEGGDWEYAIEEIAHKRKVDNVEDI